MRMQIHPGKPSYALISYNTDRCQFVGVVKFAEIEAIGKYCPRLDIELQRDLTFVDAVILATDDEPAKLRQMCENMKKALKPKYDGSPLDANADAIYRPNILHVESGAIFKTIPEAARALGVNTPGAITAVNRPRYMPRVGRPATFHLVTTHKEPTHFPPAKREAHALDYWRKQNGFHNPEKDRPE